MASTDLDISSRSNDARIVCTMNCHSSGTGIPSIKTLQSLDQKLYKQKRLHVADSQEIQQDRHTCRQADRQTDWHKMDI